MASGLRALAFTLLPLAAYLPRTRRMFTRLGSAVADWATSLVFNPMVWAGIVVAGISVVLFVVSGMLRARQSGTRSRRSGRKVGKAGGSDRLPPGGGADAG